MRVELKTENKISSLQTAELIGSNLNFSKIAVDSAIIRRVLWLDSRGANPIHTTRIINQALKFSLPDLSELDPRERLKESLEKLTYSGDLVSFSEGRWLPAALKEIVIDPSLSESLLVGGVPSSLFPKDIRKTIIHHKQYRKISSGLIDDIHVLPKFSLTSWAKIPTEDLKSWAMKIKNIKIVEFSTDSDKSQHEVYLPQLQSKTNFQHSRWRQQFEKSSGKHLCRWKQQKGTITYHIAELINGRIVGLSNALPKHCHHRFMYAEDMFEGRNVSAQTQIINDELIIKLYNYLPIGEYMIFDSLGELNTEIINPLVWKFNIKYQPVIFAALQRLKINIKEN